VALARSMTYRTIAFVAPLLLAIGCGGAAPPAASPNASPAAVPPVEAAAAQPPEAEPPPAPPAERADADKVSSAPKPVATNVQQASVVDSEKSLTGKLTQDDIRRILEKNGALFDTCYSVGATAKGKRDFRGTVTVKATIGPNGTVNAVQIIKSTAKNSKVDACVSDSFRKIKFPAPKNSAASVITFPIVFNGVEEVQN
jgi:TonB family protein